ncbi:uncharacterized protein LOC119370672 [Jatropha curcas]|uniref:uncharacterized protein LOC119370672 n=1 Tax=Jatropha curcas TaxID=180498 RepID=UPI001893BD70|nr:uncharacterized protein LOC119370672 [Jatropha curcas]
MANDLETGDEPLLGGHQIMPPQPNNNNKTHQPHGQSKVLVTICPTGSFTTWEELAQRFLAKFFLSSKTKKLRNEIITFAHQDQESLYEAWERFKHLLRKCSRHSLPKWLKLLVDLLKERKLMRHMKMASNSHYQNNSERKKPAGVYEIGNSHYQNNSERKKPAGGYEIDAITALNAKVDNMVRKLNLLITNSINSIMQACDRCNGQHGIGELRNHPNLSYEHPNNALKAPLGFPSQEKKTHDDLLTTLSKSHMDFMNETRENHKIQQAVIRNLDIQLGQFANMMASRPQGTLPNNTKKNPKEQVQAITLRNGKQLEDPPRKEDKKKE